MSLELIKNLGMRREGKTTRRWCKAKCSYCGNIVEKRTDDLKTRKSCGCATFLKAHTKHNMSKTRLYKQWADIKTRCRNPMNNRYHRYGGRGIKICDEWINFEPYMKWALENGYTDELTIDRIDNDGDYKPSNCEFVTIQENLKRRNRSRGWK